MFDHPSKLHPVPDFIAIFPRQPDEEPLPARDRQNLLNLTPMRAMNHILGSAPFEHIVLKVLVNSRPPGALFSALDSGLITAIKERQTVCVNHGTG